MKKIIVVLTCISFSLICAYGAKAQLASSSSGSFDPPCACCPPFRMLGIDCIMPPDLVLFEDFETAATGCSGTLKEFNQASKYARPSTSRINSLLKKVNRSLNLPASQCNKLLKQIITRLDAEIIKIGTRTCSMDMTMKGCISPDVTSEFIPRLQESIDEIKTILQTDDDETGIPDICRG